MKLLPHPLSTVLICLSLLPLAAAFPQTLAASHDTPRLEAEPGPEQAVAEMAQRYHLDSEQRRELKPILESRAQDLKSIAEESQLSPEERAKKIQDLRRVCNREIEAILRERQRILFDRDQSSTGR